MSACIACAALLGGCLAPAPALRADPNAVTCDEALNAPLSPDLPAQQLDLYGFLVDIDASKRCGDNGASVVFTVHGRGTRALASVSEARACDPRAVGDALPPECASLCIARPSPEATCTRASSLELANEVRAMTPDTGEWSLPSPSLAVCDEPHDDPDFSDVGLIIRDWMYLQRTLHLLAERMRAWDVGGSMRVVVQPVRCAVLEGS